LCAQVVKYGFKNTLWQSSSCSNAFQLSSLEIARKSSEDTAILTNARRDKRKRLWLGQQLHGLTTLWPTHAIHETLHGLKWLLHRRTSLSGQPLEVTFLRFILKVGAGIGCEEPQLCNEILWIRL
jgi:hypothetical protein